MKPLLTLAVETSTPAGTAALLRNDEELGTAVLVRGTAHGRELAPALGKLLAEAGCAPQDVDLVAVGLGPGSYTGLRVGAATALGFALGAECPIAAVSSFAAKALEAGKEGETVFVTASASGGSSADGEGDVCYHAAFAIADGIAAKIVPHGLESWSTAAEQVEAGWILAGEGARRLGKLVEKATFESGPLPEIRAESVPGAVWVGRLGQKLFVRDGAALPETVQPLYLRRSSAEINWDARQARQKRQRGKK